MNPFNLQLNWTIKNIKIDVNRSSSDNAAQHDKQKRQNKMWREHLIHPLSLSPFHNFFRLRSTEIYWLIVIASVSLIFFLLEME